MLISFTLASLYFFPHDGQNLDLQVNACKWKLLQQGFSHSKYKYPESNFPQDITASTFSIIDIEPKKKKKEKDKY